MGKPILSSFKGSHRGNLHCYHLPKGIVKFAIKRIGNGQQVFYAMDPPELSLAPDWNHRYYLNYAPSSFTDDDITIEFTESGFLRRIHSFIDDQTDEFINKLGELATTAIEAVVTVPSAFKTRSLEGVTEEYVYEANLDPFRKEEVDALNRDLAMIDPLLRFEAIVLDEVDEKPLEDKVAEKQVLYCRPPVMCEIQLIHGQTTFRQSVRMPHPNLVHTIEIPRAPFVKTEFLIEFNDLAYPAMINIKKPSTAMAMIQIPINILKSIIALPGQIVSFKFNYDNTVPQYTPPPMESIPTGPVGGGSDVPLPDIPDDLPPVPGTSTRSVGGAGGGNDTDRKIKNLEQTVELLRRRMNDSE
ncbi:MAG: hypothetical protein AAF927_29775 [Bacteroidota bacterium]